MENQTTFFRMWVAFCNTVLVCGYTPTGLEIVWFMECTQGIRGES